MRLNYSDREQFAKVNSVSLLKAGHRIEFHLKSRNEHTWCLVCLSGEDDSFPQKNKIQGPYHDREQAAGAMTAIISSLSGKGYKPNTEGAIWKMQAQALIRSLRTEVEGSTGDFEFDPDDVFFD